MLEIFNQLSPFFEDVYREISVREYARMRKISAPTASKFLRTFREGSLLLENKKGIYIYYRANRASSLFRGLHILFWKQKLSAVFSSLQNFFLFKNPVLFGSIAKQENSLESDVDIFVDIPKKSANLGSAERKLGRKIQLFFRGSLKNKSLQENIKRGATLFD